MRVEADNEQGKEGSVPRQLGNTPRETRAARQQRYKMKAEGKGKSLRKRSKTRTHTHAPTN